MRGVRTGGRWGLNVLRNVVVAGARPGSDMDNPPDPDRDRNLAAVPPLPRRHWGRFILAGASAILLLLFFAPQIVSWTSFRHELPRFRLPGFEEEIRVGRAS